MIKQTDLASVRKIQDIMRSMTNSTDSETIENIESEPYPESFPEAPRNARDLLRNSSLFPRLFVALVLFFTFLAIWYFMR